ncbi:MAG: hypothetical protein RLZZ366_654 [Pseudomonadota bacterium]|jgi:antitoxin VapB
MNSVNTKIFKSGNSAAVRLPRDFGLDIGMEVTLEKEGNQVVIQRKKRSSVAEMLQLLRDLPGPGEIQKRDSFEAPERPGL